MYCHQQYRLFFYLYLKILKHHFINSIYSSYTLNMRKFVDKNPYFINFKGLLNSHISFRIAIVCMIRTGDNYENKCQLSIGNHEV
jgi:hypothetical protein